MADKSSGNVIVACRIRPLNKKEIAMGSMCCLDFHPDNKQVTLNITNESTSVFGQNKF